GDPNLERAANIRSFQSREHRSADDCRQDCRRTADPKSKPVTPARRQIVPFPAFVSVEKPCLQQLPGVIRLKYFVGTGFWRVGSHCQVPKVGPGFSKQQRKSCMGSRVTGLLSTNAVHSAFKKFS